MPNPTPAREVIQELAKTQPGSVDPDLTFFEDMARISGKPSVAAMFARWQELVNYKPSR